MASSAEEAGRQALRHLDAILAQQPRADPQLFADCTRCLAGLRDGLARGAPSSLAHANAVISVVLAGRFPLGAVPWAELHKARSWLAEIVERQAVLF